MDAINPNSTFDHVCKCDRNEPPEKQTIWKIKYLSVREEAILSDNLGAVNKEGDFRINLGTQGLMALHIGLMVPENWNAPLERDLSAHPVYPGGPKPWKESHLSKIPRKQRAELSQVVINGGEEEEEERKN